MTYLDDSAIRRKVYEAFAVRGATGEHDNRPLIVRILELRREKAALLGFANFADLVLEDRMAHTGDRALAFLEDLKAKTERRFHEENQELFEFRRSPGRRRTRPSSPRGTSPTTPRSSAPRSTISTRRRCAPTSRWSAWSPDSSNSCTASTASAWRRNPACPAWDADVHYYNVRDEDGVFLGAFYADWYPRENKRGGAWMDGLITGGPVDRWLPPAPGIDLRQPHAAGGRQARAAHAPRSGDHLPRVRPPAAPPVEPRGNPLAGGHQRGVGFRRTAHPDHGELVLGARRRWTCSRATTRPASRFPTTCSRR